MSTSAKPKPPIADEATECRGLIEWRDKVGVRRYPELALLYHIPNGGYRHAWTAHQMRRQGVKPGMPDYHLPVARGQFWSLYIEMKRGDGGLLEPEQSSVHALLRGQGNRVEVAWAGSTRCRCWRIIWPAPAPHRAVARVSTVPTRSMTEVCHGCSVVR